MDHLPNYHQSPALAPLEIPFLLRDDEQTDQWTYTAEPMEQRPRFVRDVYLAPILALKDQADQARAIQKDIFFGFLRGLLGDEFDQSDFVRPSKTSGENIITLANLEARLEAAKKITSSRLRVRFLGFILPEFDQRLISDFLTLSGCIGATFRNVAPDRRTGGFLLSRVALSVEMLSWTLRVVYFLSDSDGPVPESALRDWSNANSAFCPYWSEVNLHRLSSAAFYYSASLPPPLTSPIQQPSRTSEEGCTITQCACSNAKATEMMKHAAFCSGKDCPMLGPNMSEVDEILRRGGIPLISIEDAESVNSINGPQDASTALKVTVTPYQPGRMPFVAISHVWCGSGLGNPDANSLPACQIQFLRHVTSMAANTWYFKFNADEAPPARSSLCQGYFWIDTLCIPVDKTDQEQLKQRAINSMAFIYTTASSVIVVDPVMMNIDHEDTPDIVIAARMATCPWMCRCWTFQEGFLAREILFLLRDGFINPASWIDRWDRYEEHDAANPRRTALYSDGGVYPKDRCKSVFEMRLKFEYLMVVQGLSGTIDGSVRVSDFAGLDGSTFFNGTDGMGWLDLLFEYLWRGRAPASIGYGPESVEFFVHVWNELSTRTTTMRQDLHSILAVLFGLKAEEVMRGKLLDRDQPLEARMLRILRSRQSLPLSLILYPYPAATSLCPGNEWAPLFPTLRRDHGDCRERGRPISLAEGTMSWQDERLGWAWRPEDTGSLLLLSEDPTAITISSGGVSLKWVGRLPGCNSVARDFQVQLAGRLAGSEERRHMGFFIHRWLYGGERIYNGCILEVTSMSSNDEPPVASLRFICPATFQPFDSQDQGSSEPMEDVSVMGGSSETVCVLKCDTPSWTSPTYHRSSPTTIQRFPKQISAALTQIPWLIASAANYRLEGILPQHTLYRLMMTYLGNSALGLWISHWRTITKWLIWLPFSLPLGLSWAIDVFLIYSIRVMIHESEEQKLVLTARSAYQALLAREGYFQDVKTEQSHAARDMSAALDNWQYETWGEVMVPMLSGGVLLLGGLRGERFIPLWESIPRTMAVCGITLLVETAVKVGVEAWVCGWLGKLKLWWNSPENIVGG